MKAKLDRDEVISSVTQLFWQSGYAQSSIQDITRVTGLQPGSIYHSFGSKLGMFKEALNAYGEQNKRALQDAFANSDDPRLTICEILLMMMHDAQAKDYCSCFLVKTQLELTDDKSHSAFQLAKDQLLAAEQIFIRELTKEFPHAQAREHAASLMMHIFGIRVYGVLTEDISQLQTAARQGMPWLPWQRALTA